MKKIFIAILCLLMAIVFMGCGAPMISSPAPEINSEGEPIKLSFMVEFYDNHGNNWLNVEGSSFDISPNKVREYYYNSDGHWTWGYTLASTVSVDIDGKNIETCGSTALFYDTRLNKIDIELPTDVTLSESENISINTPSDIRFKDYWTLNWWWITKDIENDTAGSRIVIIQSQEGDPICMFTGDNVTWDVSRNLPKTTEICIDGYMVYVHRANYAIVDTEIFN